MPLIIDVGISRKASRDFQSAGVSLNLRAELDQSLLAKPRELQDEIARLYREAEEAVTRQLDHTDPRPPDSSEAPAAGNGSAEHSRNGHNGNGHARHSNGRNGHGHSNGRSAAPATESQRKAIDAIARRLDLNAADEAHHEFGIDFDRMTVPEASKLIDHLKSLQPVGSRSTGAGRNGGGR
jgi:hypothetical protein